MDADTTERLTPQQVAQRLGISTEAVRQRIRRGTLRAEKTEDGSVVVLFNESVRSPHTEQTNVGTTVGTPTAEHLESLQREIEHLREQLRQANQRDQETRRLLAAALERIPALEAPGGPETPSEPVPSEAT